MDITVDLARLLKRYSCLAADPLVHPRDDVRGLVARPDVRTATRQVRALLLGEDIPTSFMLLALLPAQFPSHLVHAHHTLSIVACRMSTREAVLIWPGKEENGRREANSRVYSFEKEKKIRPTAKNRKFQKF